jgi:hypothetical protein
MSETLKEALWWTLVFVVIAVVIAAGVRIVNWITDGTGSNSQIWKAALVLIGASAGGGKAVTAIRHRQTNTKGDEE